MAGPKRDRLSLEYDNRARVPDHPEVLTAWTRRSEQARASLVCYLDRAYGPSPAERLDIFPARNGDGSALMFIHGGYWRALDKSDFSFLAPAWAEAGVSLIVVNYDLCPRVSVEEIVRQMLRASAWLYRHAADYAINRQRLFVAGHSAGGHLAAMLMAALWPRYESGLPRDLFKGAVTISGLHDLRPLVNVDFLRDDLRLDERSALRLSPAYLPPATPSPVYTCVGGRESAEFRRQNDLLRRTWRKVATVDIPMPRSNHFTVVDGLAERRSPLFAGTRDLMKLNR
jgi:arylformamidase